MASLVHSWKVIVLSEVVPVATLSILVLIIMWVLLPLFSLCNLRRSRYLGRPISYGDALRQVYTSVFLAVFPSDAVVERVDWVKARKNEMLTESLQAGDQVDRPQAEKPEASVVLFVGRQPNHRGKGLPVRYCGDCEWLKKPLFWTYFYFAVVLTLALCWGVVVFWDNFWYKKTNTCNDIRPGSGAYICYEVRPPDYPVANCTELIGKDVDVLCFEDSQSFPTALGIGFSIFQFVLLIGKIGFSIATWFGSQGDSYFWSHLFSFVTIFLGVLTLIVLVGYPAIANTLLETDATANLFFGHPPLRWWMYCLLLISLFSIFVLLGISAYMYHKNPQFQEMAKVIERKHHSDSIEMKNLKRPRAKTTDN